jgi:RNA polymerase sigma factor (TIGR02999 family)
MPGANAWRLIGWPSFSVEELKSTPQGGIIAATMNEITQVLERIQNGEPSAAEVLLPLVYEELRKLAAQRMAQENPGHTLQATALVHEAYLRLVDTDQRQHWDGRGHFFAAAAEAMRRILVERARQKRAVKHGGGRRRLDADAVAIIAPDVDEDLVAIDEALNQLAALDPVKADLVKLRYFAGLTIEECAKSMGISCATAKRYWTYSRVWLYQTINHECTKDREHERES